MPYQWKPIEALPIGLRHLVDPIVAQRYMGYTAITILWSAAFEHLLHTYATDAHGIAKLEELRVKDDKAFFRNIARAPPIQYFEDPVSHVM
jgi:hypothetical protein